MSDVQLVEKFQQGDTSTFTDLIKLYQDKVMATCVRMLGNREDAEDAAQEIFIKVYDALPRFDPRAKFSTWLYRIAMNHCLNVLRGRKVRQVFYIRKRDNHDDIEYVNPHSHVLHHNRPDNEFERREREKHIWRAIDALPQNQKVAVVLAKFGGLSYKEIAEVMQVSVSAVESLLFRAKHKLYKYLAKILDEL